MRWFTNGRNNGPRPALPRAGAHRRGGVRCHGLLIIALWQAPVGPAVGPDGGITFLFGTGTTELARFDCAGKLIDSRRSHYRVAAVAADYDVTPTMRFEGVGGHFSSDDPTHDGSFVMFRMRADARRFGMAIGGGQRPTFGDGGPARHSVPSVGVRVGSASAAHLQADVFPPSSLAESFRIGVGFNAVDRRRPAAFIGLAVVGEGSSAATGSVTLPFNARSAFSVQGYFGPGHVHAVSGIAAGARIAF